MAPANAAHAGGAGHAGGERMRPRLAPATRETERPAGPSSKGTHFILEAALGASLASELGYQGALTFGGGGRLPGSPIRGYLVFALAASRYHREEAGARRLRFDVFSGVGLRGYVGLLAGLRLYAEVLGGAQRASDTVSPSQGRDLHIQGWRPELRLGGGFQVRPIEALSLGLGVTYRAFEDDFLRPSQAAGLSPLSPWMANGTATWHF